MRLVAANGLIKLVENTNYADVMTIDQFLQLSLSVQVNGFCTFLQLNFVFIIIIYQLFTF